MSTLPSPVRIGQIVVSLGYHDAIAREAFQLAELMAQTGAETALFAGRAHSRAAAAARPLAGFVPREWDAVIHHYSSADGTLPVLRRGETRAILLYHNITPHHYFYRINPELVAANKEGRELLPDLLPLYHEVWADSQFNLDELRALGLRGGRVLPYVSADPLPGPLPPDGEREPVVLAVGRLAPNKGLPLLLAALARLLATVPAARLVVIGNDAGTAVYAERLRRQAAELGLTGRVTWAGEVTDSELAAWYRRAGCLAVASEHEGFCVPLLEAMAADCPIVATAQPAVCETLGASGVVVTARDPDVLAAALARTLTDERLRAAVVAAQRRRRADFNLAQTGPRFLEFLAAALREPSPASFVPPAAPPATSRAAVIRPRGRRALARLEPFLARARARAAAAAAVPGGKVVVVNLGHFGDLLLTTPLLRALKTSGRFAAVELVSPFPAPDVAPLIPWVDAFHPARVAPFASGALRYPVGLRRLWPAAYALALSARGDYAHHLAAYLTGAAAVAGETGGPYDELLTHPLAPLPLPVYEGERLARLAAAAGVTVAAFDPEVAVPPGRDALLARFGLTAGAYAVCHPGGGVRANWWPEASWRELLRRWTKTIPVVLVGGPDEAARAARIADGLGRVSSLAGRLTWPATAQLLAGAATFAGSDSGPLHLAAALRVPLLGLFGPDDPRRFAPRTPRSGYLSLGLPCSPCPQVTAGAGFDCPENVCLTRLDPDAVWAELVRLGLDTPPEKR